MTENNVKSGKEILDNFFQNIKNIDSVDESIANCLKDLYFNKKLSEKNILNELQKIRRQNGNEN